MSENEPELFTPENSPGVMEWMRTLQRVWREDDMTSLREDIERVRMWAIEDRTTSDELDRVMQAATDYIHLVESGVA